MLKPEAEKAIRHLSYKWFRLVGQPEFPDFVEFCSWLRSEGYSHYLTFRSVMGPMEDAELWFDQELKQTWRN